MKAAGRRIGVAGLGTSGQAALAALTGLGAEVLPIDDSAPGGTPSAAAKVEDLDLLVVSPGWAPHLPLLSRARAAGVPIWSEVELAWRLRANPDAPWLALTGTNGKTTVVEMLRAILTAAGHQAQAAGNVGVPLVEAVMDPSWDVFAVELSSFQLHHTYSMRPLAAAILNIAPDHLDWHGSMDAYRDAKARIYAGVTGASVFNAADQWAAAAAADAAPQPPAAAPGGQPDSLAAADILAGTFQAPAFDLDSRPDSSLGVTGAAGPKLVGFTLAPPAAGQLGLADGWVVDRAFGPGPGQQLVELATLGHLAGPDGQLAPHTQANILAAAALARAYGVEARGIGQGLGQFRTGAHRLELVHQAGGVRFINDSKATNAHAAAAALSAFPPGKVVWIAGGLAKGARFEDLIKARGDRLKAAVLIGLDNSELTEALDRHAPSVPVWRIEPGGDVMGRAVARAAALASASDVVLLAPASASMDQFSSYAERGQQFAAAAKEIGG